MIIALKGEAIQVAIGIQTTDGCGPMEFYLYDNGARIHKDYSDEDLIIAVAVLRDLADAIESAGEKAQH